MTLDYNTGRAKKNGIRETRAQESKMKKKRTTFAATAENAETQMEITFKRSSAVAMLAKWTENKFFLNSESDFTN